jgi:hypothetical protein
MAQAAEASFNKIKTAAGGGTGNLPDTKKDNSLEELQTYIAESQKINADAEQKEIISENIKYEKLKADLVEFHHSTEDLEEQHQLNLQNISKKYADILSNLIKEGYTKAKAEDLKGAAELQKQTEDYLNRSANINVSARQKELNDENTQFKKLLEAHMLGDGQIEAVEQQHQLNMQNINAKFDESDEEKKTKSNVASFDIDFNSQFNDDSVKQAYAEVRKQINDFRCCQGFVGRNRNHTWKHCSRSSESF